MVGAFAPSPERLAAQPSNKPTEQRLLSATSEGVAANGVSTNPEISLDGGYVVFESTATDLDRADTDRTSDIYLHDVAAGKVSLLSFAPGRLPALPGVKGDGPSHFPSVSRDARLIAFASAATNLTDDRSTAQADIFVHERASGENVLVSLTPAGGEGNGPSDRGVISADGKIVAFQSLATNLVKGVEPPAGTYRIHVHVLATTTTLRIDPPKGFANGDCRLPQISENGDLVAFESDATNLSALDENRFTDVYIFNRNTSQITLVSVGKTARAGNNHSRNPRLSPNGRLVAFDSLATDLVGGDRNNVEDVLIRDLVTGRTERVSVSPAGRELKAASTVAGISFDGRFVGFVTDLRIIGEDRNGLDDFYIRDRAYSRTFLVSGIQPVAGGPFQVGNDASTHGSISGDGQYHAYESLATNLAPDKDGNRMADVYRAKVLQAPLDMFPPSNHVFLNVRKALRQYNLDGTETGKILSSAELPVLGFAIDDLNALWVITHRVVARYKASSLEAADPAQGPIVVSSLPEPGTVFTLVAGGGYAFAAIGNSIWRFSADGELVSTQILGADGGLPERVSMALDPVGFLWVCASARGQRYLLKLDRGLKRLSSIIHGDRALNFDTVAIDPAGAIILRGRSQIAKFSRQGGVLWTAPAPGGGGLALDASGNAYTVTPDYFLGFHPTGRLFLRVRNPSGTGNAGGRIWMSIDGLGNVYAAEEGGEVVERFNSRLREPEAQLFSKGAVQVFGEADSTGFLAANIHAQKKDADQDKILNRDETLDPSNPFDPSDPSRARRLPAVLNLTATLLAGRQVRLDWDSPVRFTQFHVFRNGRPIPQSPVSLADSLGGIIDRGLLSGVHVYRVIGQGLEGGGGGLGPDVAILEPFSASAEASVAQGDGSVKVSISTPSPPDAVAYESSTQSVHAVLSGGTLWRLDTSLSLLEETLLPVDPFGEAEVRGLAADPIAAGELYILLGDGRLYRKSGAANPVLAFTLSRTPDLPLPEGFTGLALSSGNGNDLFTTMAGPGIDCLIGFLRTSGAFKSGAERSVSSTMNTPLEYSTGVSGIGGAGFLVGVGVDLNGSSPSVNRVVKLDLGANFDIQDTGASVPLGALGSFDIPGFDLATGAGLVVADRTANRIALLEAQFQGSLDILEVKPARGRWRGVTQGVEIRGTGFGADPGSLEVKFDGVGIPIQSLSDGVITVEAPAIDEAREITIEVSSATASDYLFPGFTYGFVRGDANDDGDINISDPVSILGYLFNGVSAPLCRDAADSDDNEQIQLTDAVYLLNFLFLGTQKPRLPFPDLGVDTEVGPDGDILGCTEYRAP